MVNIPQLMSRICTEVVSAKGPKITIPNGNAQEVDICKKLKTRPCIAAGTSS